MSWIDKLFRKRPDIKTAAKPQLIGRRLTMPEDWTSLSLLGTVERVYWRDTSITDKLKVIRDLSPDAAMAVWNMIRLGISDYELRVIRGYTTKGEANVDQELTEFLMDWIKNNVARDYGKGLGAFMNTAMLTLMTEGAVAVETEVTPGLDDIVDWHLVSPGRINCRRATEKDDYPLGSIIYTVDTTTGETDLPETQFRYIPVDPEIDDPYGRSPILPALVQIDFQMQLLNDLKAVVHNQGYPRIDITVLEEAVLAAAPAEYHQYGKEAELASWVESQVSDIVSRVETLNPDDAFVHLDSVSVDKWSPSGGIDFGKVEDILTAQIVTSLKQLPILLGRNVGTTETHGTVQYRIYVKGIESLREKVAELVQFCANLTLQVWGEQATAELTYESIRHTDRQKEARAYKLEHETAVIAVQQGWITNDEAARKLYSHDATGEVATEKKAEDEYAKEKETGDEQAGTKGDKEQEEKEEAGDTKFVAQIESRTSDKEWLEPVKTIDAAQKKNILTAINSVTDELVLLFQKWADVYGERLRDATSSRAAEGSETWVSEVLFQSTDTLPAEMENIVLPHYETVIKDAASGEWEKMQKAGLLKMQPSFSLLDPKASAYITAKKGSFKNVGLGMMQKVMKEVRSDFKAGIHPFDTARELSRHPEKFGLSYAQAERIARTEMLDASNYGSFLGYQQSNIVDEIEWVATDQENTCEECAGTAGEQVKLGEEFSIGVIRPPAHPNCRCTTVVSKFKSMSLDSFENEPGQPVDEGPNPRSTRPTLNEAESDKLNRMLAEGLNGDYPQNVPWDERGAVKDVIVRDLRSRLEKKVTVDEIQGACTSLTSSTITSNESETLYRLINDLIHQWAATSADDNVVSIAIQMAAQEELKLPASALKALEKAHQVSHGLTDITMKQANAAYRANEHLLREFIRAQYEATQDYFKAKGITDVPLLRGFHVEAAWEGPTASKVAEVLYQPLNSGTFNTMTARTFAGYGRNSIMTGIRVPIEYVLSTCRTGIGCLNESEIVFMGGNWQAAVIRGVGGFRESEIWRRLASML